MPGQDQVPATISVLTAAKFLGRHSHWSLTAKNIQHMIYCGQMYQMGSLNRPLVHGRFEATREGPVHPVLHKHIKSFGANAVRNVFRRESDLDPGSLAADLLQEIAEMHAAEPERFEQLALEEEGAWAQSFASGAGTPIENRALKADYVRRAGSQALDDEPLDTAAVQLAP